MRNETQSSCAAHGIPETPEWVSAGGFVPLILGTIAMFWGLAFICEEYCVPSITVFCKRNRIPDDIAGAIFIGTGLSLPVLFASFVGLFISHSAIGVGTVVGGDAFNHLVNIALSIYVAPDKTLKLDAVIFTRESFFYVLSCFFVIWAVEYRDVALAFYQMRDVHKWTNCMSIPWGNSTVLIACYVVYCVFDSYFQRILDVVHKYTRRPTSPSRDLLNIHPHAMTVDTTAAGVYMQNVSTEDNIPHASSLAADVLSGPHMAPPSSPTSNTQNNNRRRSNPDSHTVIEDNARKKTSFQLSSNDRHTSNNKQQRRVVMQYSNIATTGGVDDDDDLPLNDQQDDDSAVIDLEFNSPDITLSQFMLGKGKEEKETVQITRNGSSRKNSNNKQHNNNNDSTPRKMFVSPRVYSPSGQFNSYSNYNNNDANINNDIIRFSVDPDDDFSVNSGGSISLGSGQAAQSVSSGNNNNIQIIQFNEQPPAQRTTKLQSNNNTIFSAQNPRDIDRAQVRAEETVDFNAQNDHTLNKKTKNSSSSGLMQRSGGGGGGGGGGVSEYLAATRADGLEDEEEYPVDWGDFQMYLKSTFYATNDFGCIPSARKWKLRYFTFDEHGLRYRLEAHLGLLGPHVRFVDIFDLESVTVLDATLFEFSIKLRSGNKKYYFRAPDVTTFRGVLRRLRAFIEEWKVRSEGERTAMALKSIYEISNGFDAALVNPDSECVADDLFVLPSHPLAKAFFLLMFPQKYAIYLTVPDVRRPGSEDRAMLAIFMCVAWLAFQSYLLIMSLTLIGDWLGIRGRIMGLTIGAWAASYPALWSSIVVARNGYGDVASCNALGSNVFSNFIGLGLPWLVYSIVYGGKPYDQLQDDGVVLSILLMVMIMLAYYVMVALSGWTLRGWMVYPMLITYFAYIGYLIYVMWEM